MKWLVTQGSKNSVVELPEQLDGLFEVKVGGETFHVEWNSDHQIFFLIDGKVRKPLSIRNCKFEKNGENIFSEEQSVEYELLDHDTGMVRYITAQLALTAGGSTKDSKRVKTVTKALKTHMAGNVLKINVKIGQSVKKGVPLIVLEAMKMENQILSPRDGTIGSILVEEKASVIPGQELIHFLD